eukprot:gnl/TRDRNA2_/TRDRNA2_84018_c0_seq2.p1 gnl/TRDRNA2_/TRDRNA2_84018_c0~~gnl/TRDRNA2_/TRDRNA2_84018_c0_seq2.p1  ORF type:complete len:220 (+),score=42.91 gnl/TRDRNA2_/TRDRNA2_84018_c0_seq2:68-727(+)
MSNRNSFLAVVLDDATTSALDSAARAICGSPAELLGLDEDCGFDPMPEESLHMTFIFFGEHLRELLAVQLRGLHSAVQEEVAAVATCAAAAPLVFSGFELFPPGKMNLVVARFEAPEVLLHLHAAVLEACKKHGASIPSSVWHRLAGDGAWTPHVTLGKIRATRAQIGKASCDGLHDLAPVRMATPCGLTLLGERPPRAWCDWDQALSFAATEDDTDVE